MEIQQLIYFAKIAELQNITRASSQLYISQPALSKSIRSLEAELDTQLFLRKGKNIYLTENGKIFHQRVQKILENLYSARREMDELNHNSSLTVRLKVRALAGILPDILSEFRKKHPDVLFSVHQGGELDFPESNYDLIILPVYSDGETRSKKFLMQEELFLAVSKNNPLSQLKQCALSDIGDTPFIHTTKQRFYWEIVENLFSTHQFYPNTVMSSDDPNTIINLVRNDFGVSLIPEYSVNPYSLNGVELVPLAEQDFYRKVYVKWADGIYMPQKAQNFYHFLMDYFQCD